MSEIQSLGFDHYLLVLYVRLGDSVHEPANLTKGGIKMGDRSPKANQKQATQKKAKNSAVDAKKNAATASKQVPGKKK